MILFLFLQKLIGDDLHISIIFTFQFKRKNYFQFFQQIKSFIYSTTTTTTAKIPLNGDYYEKCRNSVERVQSAFITSFCAFNIKFIIKICAIRIILTQPHPSPIQWKRSHNSQLLLFFLYLSFLCVYNVYYNKKYPVNHIKHSFWWKDSY